LSQRDSGYARIADDKYFTPAWVTEALLPHLRIKPPAHVHEPAAGNDAIVDVLKDAGFNVTSNDFSRDRGVDFLDVLHLPAAVAIITNPPYNKAEEFIAHALDLMEPRGLVAMLLRSDYDHAITRSYLFDRPPFAKRVVLRKRIRWIENSTGSPSYNHCWYIFDWQHKGPPTIGYAP
jgi:hypothetical protein